MGVYTCLVSRFLGILGQWGFSDNFLQRLLLCGGVTALVTVEDFDGFAHGLFKSSSRFAMEQNAGISARAAKSWPRIALIFAASPQEETYVGG
jgi:hypothetical protein